jgi:hypothetical protein
MKPRWDTPQLASLSWGYYEEKREGSKSWFSRLRFGNIRLSAKNMRAISEVPEHLGACHAYAVIAPGSKKG